MFENPSPWGAVIFIGTMVLISFIVAIVLKIKDKKKDETPKEDYFTVLYDNYEVPYLAIARKSGSYVELVNTFEGPEAINAYLMLAGKKGRKNENNKKNSKRF